MIDKTCKNCKFYDIEDFFCNRIPESDSWITDPYDIPVYNAQFLPPEDFGCNRFKEKEDGKKL